MTTTELIETNETEGPNVPEIHGALTRLTANLARWNQGAFCDIPDGVEGVTDEHLETGLYHDFRLAPEVIEAFKDRAERYSLYSQMLPIADCGTTFCVAGDVAVTHGYVFVATEGDDVASQVVPFDRLDEFLVHSNGWGNPVHPRQAFDVAQHILGLSYMNAMRLFDGSCTLIDVWAIGFGITQGHLELPAALPETTTSDEGQRHVITPAYTSAAEVQQAVHDRLARMVMWNGWTEYRDTVDVEALSPTVRTEFKNFMTRSENVEDV